MQNPARPLVRIGAKFDQSLSQRLRDFAGELASVCLAVSEILASFKKKLSPRQKYVLAAVAGPVMVYITLGLIRCAAVAFSDHPRITYEPMLDWWWKFFF